LALLLSAGSNSQKPTFDFDFQMFEKDRIAVFIGSESFETFETASLPQANISRISSKFYNI
jgi:hypothetical protein